jgi:hypothetical protein
MGDFDVELSPDGVDFGSPTSGLVFLKKNGRTYRVLRMYFASEVEESIEYGISVRELDYQRYLRWAIRGNVDDFAVGEDEDLIVTASPRLKEDIIEYASWRYGRPGFFYLTIEGDETVIWRFSDHIQERP